MGGWRESLILAALSMSSWACSASSSPASALRLDTILADKALGYAVALHPRGVASVELTTHFELVIRSQATPIAPTREVRAHLGPPEYDVHDLAYDPWREQFWSASASGVVTAHRLDGRLAATIRLGLVATAVAVGEHYLVAASADGSICLRSLEQGALLQCVAEHGDRVSDLEISDDLLLSASWDGSVIAWSLPGLSILDSRQSAGSANALALDDRSGRLAVARSHLPPQRSPAMALREEKGLTSPHPGDRVEIWSLRGGVFGAASPVVAKGHTGPVTSVAWSRGQIVSGSWDRSVRLWNASSGKSLRTLRSFSHIVKDVVSGDDGTLLAVAAWSTDHRPAVAVFERSLR